MKMSDEQARALFIRSCDRYIEETRRYSGGVDLTKAANGNSSSEEFREEIYRAYNSLVRSGHLIEGYCLFRLTFGVLSTEQLMKLSEENMLLREREAYAAAKHDEVPF